MPKRSLAIVAALLCLPLAAATLAAFGATTHDQAESQQSSPSFSLVLSVAGMDVTARCEEGCAWETVSASYPRGVYRLTAEGIQPVLAVEEPPAAEVERPAFSFVVDASGSGVSATCERGCAWETVSARYPMLRYRITDRGIAPTR